MRNRKKENFLFGCLITLALFIILLVILSQIKIMPTEVYYDEEYKFSLKYPAYWPMTVRPEQGMALIQFIVPEEEQDKFYDNVNITVVDLSTRPQLQDINRFSRETMRQTLGLLGKGVHVLDSSSTRWGGLPAFRLSYVTREKTPITNSRMKYFYIWTVKGDKAFIMLFAGDQADVDAKMSEFNIIVKSFKFDK